MRMMSTVFDPRRALAAACPLGPPVMSALAPLLGTKPTSASELQFQFMSTRPNTV